MERSFNFDLSAKRNSNDDDDAEATTLSALPRYLMNSNFDVYEHAAYET